MTVARARTHLLSLLLLLLLLSLLRLDALRHRHAVCLHYPQYMGPETRVCEGRPASGAWEGRVSEYALRSRGQGRDAEAAAQAPSLSTTLAKGR